MSFRYTGTNDRHPAPIQPDCSFAFLIQRAALLGLKETGMLDEMAHRQAEAALRRQYADVIRANAASADDD